MKLRPYQEKAKQDVYNVWKSGKKNALFVLATGGGKTRVLANIVHEHVGGACVIAHRQELVSQISLALAREGVRHKIIGPSNVVKLCVKQHMEETGQSWYTPSSQVAVAGVDTLVRRTEELKRWLPSVTLWVTDECFPAGTLIGETPIEQIKCGDYVTAFNELTEGFEERKVVRLFKKQAPNYMVKVVSQSHHVTISTFGHPFWTKRGWVEAINLTTEDEVLIYGRKTFMLSMRGRFSSKQLAKISATYNRSKLLLNNLFQRISEKNIIRNNGENKPTVRFGEDEAKQSYATPRGARESVTEIERDRSPTKSTGWEWERSHEGGENVIRVIKRLRFLFTGHSQNGWLGEFFKMSKPLQDRLCKRIFKNSDRGGWKFSLFFKTKRAGSTKRDISTWDRLASVTVLERDNLILSPDCAFDGHVYNIEVEELHTYTANGVVVHNCHHITQGTKWHTACEMFPNAKGLGVTATPLRADGKGLGRHADGVFDEMVLGPSMAHLIRDGYLTKYRIFAPPSDLDLTAVKIGSTGDFSAPALAQATRKSHVMGDVVSHYLRIAKGKLGITFATDVQSAKEIAEQFIAAGVPAIALDAKTPDADRISALRRFKRRELMQLVNVDLFGEGFDLPAIEVCSMARATQSYGLYVQIFGRALRLMEGKEHAIIIDHVGNVVRHGLPDAPRTWTLDRRDKRESSKSDDVIPVKACPECTQVYERVYAACPYCGFKPIPAIRSGPEQVDGDLHEMDEATLSALRSGIESIDRPVEDIRAECHAKHIPQIGHGPHIKRHMASQKAQVALRETIAWWAGYRRAEGMADSESYRRFYFKFGVDVLTAQGLGEKEALSLNERITLDISFNT